MFGIFSHAPPPPQNLETWFSSSQGHYILEWEKERAGRIVEDIFGFYAIQYGLPDINYLEKNRISNRYCISTHFSNSSKSQGLIADPMFWPFPESSIDLVMLPHLLEFHACPRYILQEVARILRPEGQLVIIGFNPYSLWGLQSRFSTHRKPSPWNGRYLGVHRLKEWLGSLGLSIDRGNFGCYAPPLASYRRMARLGFLEKAGDRWWGFAGGVYIIRAIKRVHGLRLIHPGWKNQLIPPSTQAASVQKNMGISSSNSRSNIGKD